MSNRKYHYRASRVRGRVERKYLGPKSDPVVELLYRADRLEQEQKKAYRNQLRTEHRCYRHALKLLLDLDELGRRAADMWLGCRGLGLNERWQFKDKRTKNIGGNKVPSNITREDFEELVALAESGNEKALNSFRQLIASDRETFRPFGDLTKLVKDQYLKLISQGDLVAKETVTARLNELQGDLLKQSSNPILRILVDQVGLAWLDVHYRHVLAAQSSPTATEAKKRDKQLENSQKRFNSIIETLAKVCQMSST